jgi:hypothetical protein
MDSTKYISSLSQKIALSGYPLVNIQKAIENGPVEIVSFPMKNCDFPVRYVSLPEGIPLFSDIQDGVPQL